MKRVLKIKVNDPRRGTVEVRIEMRSLPGTLTKGEVSEALLDIASNVMMGLSDATWVDMPIAAQKIIR